MRLASLATGGRDGTLVVVDRALSRCTPVPEIAPTLRASLDDWRACAPRLHEACAALNEGRRADSRPFNARAAAAPLPRAAQFLDASAYLHHVELVRRARGAEMPPALHDEPLMYQGCSDPMLGACAPIRAADAAWGIDLEGEIAVITDDVPCGINAQSARVCLVMLLNDVSLRNLIPNELAKGFGFVHGKPPSACAPVAVSPDALGGAWHDGRLHARMEVRVNDRIIGTPRTGRGMAFDFARLIAHAARTRPLGAGTVIGSGTVSNAEPGTGAACLAEVRMDEVLADGAPTTPFLQFGDRVRIDVVDDRGASLFGAIEQVVEPCR